MLLKSCYPGNATKDQSPANWFGPILVRRPASCRKLAPAARLETLRRSRQFRGQGAEERRRNVNGKGNAMLSRRDLLRSAALAPAAAALPLSLLAVNAAHAQAIDLLKMFVPAAPGGGWDQTARTMEQVLRATGAVDRQ